MLFGPLTGIEVQHTRVDGAVVVIVARLSVNLNAMTLEVRPRPTIVKSGGVPLLTPSALVHLQAVISKMQRSLEGLVTSFVDQLRFASAPPACMAPLEALRAQEREQTGQPDTRRPLLDPQLFVLLLQRCGQRH